MAFERDADIEKFGEINFRLWHDVVWKLNKIMYSLPPPKAKAFTLTDNVEEVIRTIEQLQKDIQAYVNNKFAASGAE